ncbi:MAG: (4Fe-4S)-binding protein, partial [Anaerolineae bacterium]|nr:(4Fe-4S)-binding protein [Anaerolineae bacterium]
ADMALLVVEPTVSGAHDLERVLATTDHFGVPAVVVVNKADLNPTRTNEIASFCAGQEVEVVGRIPYDTVVTEAMVAGQPVTAVKDSMVTHTLQAVWKNIKEALW